MSLSSDLCYSTFQQGDLEKTPLALWRAPRLTFSRSRRRSFSAGGTTGRSALQGQFMALSGAPAPRLTPPAAPGSGIVPSLGYRERRKGWRPFPTSGDNVRPQTCHTRRRGDMERICPRVGAGHSAFPRKEGKKLSPNPRTPNSSSGYLYESLMVTVHTHWKYAGGKIEKALQRTQSRVRTKRQSVNLGTVGLCAQGLDGPNVNRRLNSALPGAETVVTRRKADAGLSRESVARR